MAKLKKIFTKDFRAHRAYFAMLENKKIRPFQILAESMHGVTVGGNIEKILEELTCDEEFSEYKIYLGVGAELFKQVKNNQIGQAGDGKTEKSVDWKKITPVIINSKEYFEALATSKYLINDTTFVHSFIKREGQVYLNTWHGTPLKNLGKSVEKERFSMGNVQKNFLASDVLLFPNEHTEKVICRDYYLDNFCQAHIARTGYPRNEAFFDEKGREQLRHQLGFEGKNVYAYLPTWRGNMGKVQKEQIEDLKKQLHELDTVLQKERHEQDIMLYVKLHPMLSEVMDTENYRCIKSFDPSLAPLYAFLQATDGLITDYSSILFDYALTGRDIILYTYDEEEYIRDHGLYIGLDELPFTRVHTIAELADRILTVGDGGERSKKMTAGDGGERSKKMTAGDGGVRSKIEDFLNRFCPYDAAGVTKKLLKDLLSGEYTKYPRVAYNGKKNAVIYGGDFIRNGITVSLLNLLKNLDTEKNNYLVLYEMKEGLAYEPALSEIPAGIDVLGASPVRVQTIWEALRTKGWEKAKAGSYKGLRKYYRNIGRKEAAKIFGSSYCTDTENRENTLSPKEYSPKESCTKTGLRMDCAIHFTGYSPLYMLALESLPCRRTIFVHNDMVREAQKPYAMPSELVADMYCSYDNVALITEGQRKCTEEFIRSFGKNIPEEISTKAISEHVITIPNVFDYELVQKRAEEKLSFDAETVSNHTPEQIMTALDGASKVLINIGRFSPEKGQLRLIDAFEQALDEASEGSSSTEIPYLIILGSYGVLFEQVMERAKNSKYGSNIIIIKAMRNPYPLLKRCSLFVLSSVYEGLPLTIMEADTLKVPCISTAVGAGPELFMKKTGGRLVPDSMEGIRDGITGYFRGSVPALLNADYENMKKEAISAFEEIINP